MSNIYYISNTNDNYHPNNTKSKFKIDLHPSSLDYLPDGDLECAVKSITATRDDNTKYQCLGLKSNIIKDWEKLLCLVHLEKNRNSHFYTEFENPTFFPTTRQLLSKASFEFIDLDSNTQPSFTQHSTVIQVVVKQQTKRMKHPFQIHLDSSCKISKEYFPSNTNMEFTVQLPKRLDFKKNWSVALKSISFSNNIFNVTDCWLKIEGDKSGIIKIEDGYYPTIETLKKELDDKLETIFNFFIDKKTGNFLFLTLKIPRAIVKLSDNFRKLLNLPTDKIDNSIRKTGNININELLPQHFLVCCDFVENSIYGDKPIPVLKYQPIPKVDGSTVLNFDFLYSDFLQMKKKTFDSIKIQILDDNRKPLQCKNDIPTRIQLLFVNTNSA